MREIATRLMFDASFPVCFISVDDSYHYDVSHTYSLSCVDKSHFQTQGINSEPSKFVFSPKSENRCNHIFTSGAMNPCVPAKLVMVVAASIVPREKPPAPPEPPGPLDKSSPTAEPPSTCPPGPTPEAFAPRVSLLTSKSANKNRPSAWTRMLPGWDARNVGRRKLTGKRRDYLHHGFD